MPTMPTRSPPSTTDWGMMLPNDLGPLPLAEEYGGRLHRTEPRGSTPARIAIVGLYPAQTRRGVYTARNGSRLSLPVEVERRSFEGSRSASELEQLYLKPLGLSFDQLFLIDLYPYCLTNTAEGENGRSTAANVQTYCEETGRQLRLEPRPEPDQMVERCRTLPGNTERLREWFALCAPRLVITLGAEVAAYSRTVTVAEAQARYLYAAADEELELPGVRARVAHCVHPGLLMRQPRDGAWRRRHAGWCEGEGRELVRQTLGA